MKQHINGITTECRSIAIMFMNEQTQEYSAAGYPLTVIDTGISTYIDRGEQGVVRIENRNTIGIIMKGAKVLP